MKTERMLLASVVVALSVVAQAQSSEIGATSPQANERTYGQNYKDMVLAACLAHAYQDMPAAGADAGSSATALRDWTEYDMENSPDAIKGLIDSYLSRDYSNPIAESEKKGIKFDLLKCLDLYHSKALDLQVKRFVSKPDHTAKQAAAPK